ncbi:MAG: WYL domain-containing protein, partial [Defluviitaleaceae bacterium]|nr:WYL domain-containing protein [Defluviitaleaceae bacterium]
FEEYAKKPYCERECVFFHDTVATIRRAIELERALILTQLLLNDKRARNLIMPYSIQTDKLSMYNYLVGFSCKMNNNDNSMKPLGIRLSKIADIKIDESGEPGSGKLSEKMRADIKTSLTSHDAMFITGADKSQNIEVRLTTKGRRYYEQQIHMRPQYSSIIGENADIYVFDCSPRQAKYYFFKFGKEAEILSPPSLRETFIDMYTDAVGAYTPNNIPI